MLVANVFHAGDGNLHPLVCFDGRNEGEAERAEELSGPILDACLDAGGSITGEHGVGVDKKKHMPKMFDEPDLDAFQRLRCACDPRGLANPGKVMPTPRLCGEVPGRLPPAPARGGRAGGAVLRPATAEEAAALLRALGEEGRPVRPRGGGTKPLGPGRRDAVRRDRRPEPHPRAQRRRLHRGRSRRACRSPRRRRRSPSTARCSRSTRRARRRGDRRRRDRDRRLRAAAPPLRRHARPRRRRDGRAVGRHARALGRQGDQERRRLRPRQAVHRLVRHARADRPRRRAAAPAAAARPPPRWARATTRAARRARRAALAARPLEADCLDVDWRDGAGGCSCASAAPRPASRRPRGRADGDARAGGRASIEDDDELWMAPARAPARRRAC